MLHVIRHWELLYSVLSILRSGHKVEVCRTTALSTDPKPKGYPTEDKEIACILLVTYTEAVSESLKNNKISGKRLINVGTLAVYSLCRYLSLALPRVAMFLTASG